MWIKKFTDVNMMKKNIEIRTMKIEDYTEVIDGSVEKYKGLQDQGG